MIIYNVTLSIAPESEDEVLLWLKREHIPEVMKTGLFIRSDMYKILQDPVSGNYNSFAIQYLLESWDQYFEYRDKHAGGLQAKTQLKFGDKVLAFRTFLEKLD